MVDGMSGVVTARVLDEPLQAPFCLALASAQPHPATRSLTICHASFRLVN